MYITKLTDDTCTTFLAENPCVLVLFTAEWCGPSRVLMPILEKLAHTYDPDVKIATLDIDTNSQTALRFQVRGIPICLFFQNGQIIAQQEGVMPEEAMDKLIQFRFLH